MVCLRDIKYLTKKKALVLQPIYYAKPVLNLGGKPISKPTIIKLEGKELEKAIDDYLLFDDHRCFTTEQEALDCINNINR